MILLGSTGIRIFFSTTNASSDYIYIDEAHATSAFHSSYWSKHEVKYSILGTPVQHTFKNKIENL